jgi:MFS family permease
MLMRRSLLAPRLKSRNRGGLAAGFRYVWGRSDLKVVFVTVFLIGAFGMNFPIFASTMALEFGAGADGYGVLSSVLAIGSLIGALLAARRDRARVRVVILAAGGFGIAAFVSSAMPSYASYAVTLTFTGFMIVTLLTTANGYVQITTDPALRGRVLALYMAVIMGSTPVGAPIAGWVADTFGPRAAIMLGGTAGFIACAIGVIWVATSGRLRRDENRRFLLTLDETRPLSVIDRPDPIEFSDEAAVTTPIRTPKRPDLEA